MTLVCSLQTDFTGARQLKEVFVVGMPVVCRCEQRRRTISLRLPAPSAVPSCPLVLLSCRRAGTAIVAASTCLAPRCASRRGSPTGSTLPTTCTSAPTRPRQAPANAGLLACQPLSPCALVPNHVRRSCQASAAASILGPDALAQPALVTWHTAGPRQLVPRSRLHKPAHPRPARLAR